MLRESNESTLLNSFAVAVFLPCSAHRCFCCCSCSWLLPLKRTNKQTIKMSNTAVEYFGKYVLFRSHRSSVVQSRIELNRTPSKKRGPLELELKSSQFSIYSRNLAKTVNSKSKSTPLENSAPLLRLHEEITTRQALSTCVMHVVNPSCLRERVDA